MKTIDSTVKKICEQPIVKKIHKRREASREKILQVSIELFYDVGYDKTTARQIAQRSGILIGSLYNIFSSKEEIFKAIIMGAYNEALDESEEILRERGDYFSAVIFPGALELYAASRSKRAAELLYQAHQSWSIVEGLAERSKEWISSHFPDYMVPEGEIYHRNILMILGCIGNLIGEFKNTDHQMDYREGVWSVVSIFTSLFGKISEDVNDSVDNICDIVESENIMIFGIDVLNVDKTPS